MLEDRTLDELARELDEAERTRSPVTPCSMRHPSMTIDDAYDVQRRWNAVRRERGAIARGHKIGLTSKAMQRGSGIDEPDYGVLFDDMFHEDGADVPIERFIVPRVECELAFVLSGELFGDRVDVTDVLAATRYVVPAIEIIDSRVEMSDASRGIVRGVRDTISDNGAAAGVILGGRPVLPHDVDLRWVPALCYRNGTIEESGVAAAVLNHPARGVAWLARRLHRFGERLLPGHVVLAGSFTRVVPARRDDVFHVDFGPLGGISCRFA